MPFLNQPVVPDAAAPGGPQFTLTVKGTGFLPTSGAALPTTFVSNKRLTAVVPAADIATAATASITVVNPSPGGGTASLKHRKSNVRFRGRHRKVDGIRWNSPTMS